MLSLCAGLHVECRSRTADKLVVLAECKPRPADKLVVLAECKPRPADKLDGFCSFSFEWILLIFTRADRSRAAGNSEFADGSRAAGVVKLSNESRVIGKVVELPDGSRAIGKVGFAKCKPRPAGKIFWELSVAAIDCSAKDSGSDFLSWHSPRV